MERRGSTQPREDLPIKPVLTLAPPESKRIRYGETLELEAQVKSIPPAQLQVRFQREHRTDSLFSGTSTASS